ncbi:MAG TPA: ATP-binding protein, partial [Methanomassiliicoccales archaeon]|nr:ATP-binding protein [Methanomassiliicoccales archaeon]
MPQHSGVLPGYRVRKFLLMSRYAQLGSWGGPGQNDREAVDRASGEALGRETPIRLTGQPVVGRWDRMRLDQVVTNLLANALKYGARRPVEVEVEARGAEAVLRVRDQGIGIAPESLARIFDRFERADNAAGVPGLGL